MLKKLQKIFQCKLEPAPIESIDEPTIWIEKDGIKGKRYIDVYESNLDIFLSDGWEVCE